MEILPGNDFEEGNDQKDDATLNESQDNSVKQQELQVESSQETAPIRVSAFGPDIYGNF